MTFRLGEYVVRGWLNNSKNYSTFGRFELAGCETPVMFELTGNCAPDLQGKRIYFEAAPSHEKPAGKPPKVAGQLIGVTGTMTAAGWVRTFECSTEEFCRRSKLGEAPPTTWKRHLYLEFYCQHGPTLIELAGPLLEYNAGEGKEEDWRPLPEVTPPPGEEEERRMAEQAELSGPEITIVHPSGESERIDPREYLDSHATGDESLDLQRQLDAQAAAVDRAITGDDIEEDPDRLIAEMELMDHLITHEDGDPLSLAFQTPRRLPRPEDLSDERIETLLKCLLAELALCGVALHVCEHYSPRDTYRLLAEKIGTEWTFHPQLAGTGWVQNYMTSEYCAKCEEEVLRDTEEFNKTFEQENKSTGEEEPPWG